MFSLTQCNCLAASPANTCYRVVPCRVAWEAEGAHLKTRRAAYICSGRGVAMIIGFLANCNNELANCTRKLLNLYTMFTLLLSTISPHKQLYTRANAHTHTHLNGQLPLERERATYRPLPAGQTDGRTSFRWMEMGARARVINVNAAKWPSGGDYH